MYRRKFPKTKVVAENSASQLTKMSSNSLSTSTPSVSSKSILDDDESQPSPSMLEEFSDIPLEKKRKTQDNFVEDTTDTGSEPLFDDNDDDPYSYLKQTLLKCGLHLKCDQNTLSKNINKLSLSVCYLCIILSLFNC